MHAVTQNNGLIINEMSNIISDSVRRLPMRDNDKDNNIIHGKEKTEYPDSVNP